MTKNNPFKMRNVLLQCAAGIAAGFLNLLLLSAAVRLEVPLFMDTLFTVAASCFGWIGGIVAALSTHAVSFVAYGYALPEDLPNRIFVLCSLTMVAGVRLMLFRKNAAEGASPKPLRLLILGIVLAFVISFEGGLFYYALTNSTRYIVENQAVSTLLYAFVTQNIPMLTSATLARFPVNLVDKTIAVFGGYGIFALLQKVGFQRKSRSGNQTKNSASPDIKKGV